MSPWSDDVFDTLEEAAMDDSLAAFVAELRGFASGPVPEPSAELALLLAGLAPPGIRRRRPALTTIGAAAAAVVIVTGGAAAQHALPEPAQSVVSDVVHKLTPFHLNDLRLPLAPRLVEPFASEHPSPAHFGAPAVPVTPKSHVASHPKGRSKGQSKPARGAAAPPVLAAATPTSTHRGRPGHENQPHFGIAARHVTAHHTFTRGVPISHRHRDRGHWDHHKRDRQHWHHRGHGHSGWSHRQSGGQHSGRQHSGGHDHA
jgi:hypothetical protein